MKNIIIVSLLVLFISCSKSGNAKVDNFLNKYEETVNLWVNKSESGQSFNFDDINEMNKLNLELASEANSLKGTETWTSEQTDRYASISLKFINALAKVSGNIGSDLNENLGDAMKDLDKNMQDYNKAMKDIEKSTKDFEKEMQKLKDLYK